MGLALPLELEGKEMNHYYVEDEEKHYPEGLPGNLLWISSFLSLCFNEWVE